MASKIIKPEPPKIITDLNSAYVPLDIIASVDDYGNIIQGGDTTGIDSFDTYFKWMRGFVNGWYGWANDGKTTYTDFLMVLKSKISGWKWCLYKQENMDVVVRDKKVEIKANRIYHNLAWHLTGKTWNEGYARKHKLKAMTLDEQMEALEFITKHFFVIYPKDRQYKNILDHFKFMYEKFGIDGFMLDPWNTVKLPEGSRSDQILSDAFIDIKELAMLTNSSFNIITHPKSMNEVKEKNGQFKVVNQYMILGGSAWDMKLDGQYSIYRPTRHNDASNPAVEFHNLKQREAEIVGVSRGTYDKIEFDVHKKQYYFNNINPMTGEPKGYDGDVDIFSSSKKEEVKPTDDMLPF